MAKQRVLISFDWALKKLLRNRANFEILEGFLSVLLDDDLTIKTILESESNSEEVQQKVNRVDLLVETGTGELIIIELQYSSEFDYFQRTLFATSKLITEYLEQGMTYEKVRKVYSINLLYFDLGQGKDYVYRGKTTFTGVHLHDELQLSIHQQDKFQKQHVSDIYPEYFVIKINNFDDVAKDSLDEWIYYLKNNEVLDEFRAKGLEKVRQKLRLDSMDKIERRTYNSFIENQLIEESMFKDARLRGEYEGRQEGIAEGRREGKAEGKAEGIAEGKAEGKTEQKRNGIIKALRRGKLSVEEIAEDFDVTIAYVLTIKNTL
jgi:predicted transposase/invertase (TIGR01784 family)